MECRAMERLFPALMGTVGKKLVRIRFIPSEDYYRKIYLNDDLLDEVVQGLGNGLAARCPGLAVSVNGHQYIYDEGIQGYVKKHLESMRCSAKAEFNSQSLRKTSTQWEGCSEL